MRLETLTAHAGVAVDPVTGAVAQPIHFATTFERDADNEYRRGFNYGRYDNPNRRALERCLAELEGGAAAAAFASGLAATHAVFQCLRPGDHVVAAADMYYGAAKMLRELFTPWGLETTFVDLTDLAAARAAVRPATKLIWTETPSNPLWKITDIAALAEVAHAAGALLAVDSTAATPVLQRPFELGADLVMHSTTKYLGGHGDITGGIVVAKREDDFFQRLRELQRGSGAVPSPFDCWLLLRGIRSLACRVRTHSANAAAIAAYLARHPKVHAVHYPGLPGHPGHAIAKRQMADFGGMVSFQVKGGAPAAIAVAAGVKLFVRATSFGGTESLIEHRASVEGPTTRTPDDLLRLSVGLEHPDDLIADVAQALG